MKYHIKYHIVSTEKYQNITNKKQIILNFGLLKTKLQLTVSTSQVGQDKFLLPVPVDFLDNTAEIEIADFILHRFWRDET